MASATTVWATVRRFSSASRRLARAASSARARRPQRSISKEAGNDRSYVVISLSTEKACPGTEVCFGLCCRSAPAWMSTWGKRSARVETSCARTSRTAAVAIFISRLFFSTSSTNWFNSGSLKTSHHWSSGSGIVRSVGAYWYPAGTSIPIPGFW